MSKLYSVFHKADIMCTFSACVGHGVACECRAICKAAGHDDVLHLFVPDQLANGSGYQDEDESETMRFSKIVSSHFYYCQHGRRFRERTVDRQRHIEDLQHIVRGVVQDVICQV